MNIQCKRVKNERQIKIKRNTSEIQMKSHLNNPLSQKRPIVHQMLHQTTRRTSTDHQKKQATTSQTMHYSTDRSLNKKTKSYA